MKLLAGDLESLQKENGVKGDSVDLALGSTVDSITSQLAANEDAELKLIESRIDDMRKGEYGVCQGTKEDGTPCKKQIPVPRLNALPYADKCIECQEEAERKGEV